MQYTYYALIKPETVGFSLRFHDLPDLACWGQRREEALIRAADMLVNRLSGSGPKPPQTPLTEVAARYGEQVIAIGVDC
jgi:hypothetical protein